MKFLQINRLARFFLVTSLAVSAALFSVTLVAQESDVTGDNQDVGIATGGEISARKMQVQEPNSDANLVAATVSETSKADASTAAETASEPRPPKAESIDLKDVIIELDPPPPSVPETPIPTVQKEPEPQPSTLVPEPEPEQQVPPLEVTETEEPPAVPPIVILGVEVPPSTSTRLVWTPEDVVSGLAERTPILVVNGKNPGQTLCLTGAVHGDELNGIEMIRRIMYQLEPDKLTGTVIGVPVVNIMGFRRNSRYLPDRRDLNRYFPGNTHGSSASRIAHSFFTNIISHCDALVDIHTGSFHRTNLTQLRADLSNERVATLAQSFGEIAVLNSRGNSGSLRAAAVRAGIPSVTVEAGEPMRMQSDVVAEGTKAIETLLAKMEMYGRSNKWGRQAPVYYKSVWVRANQSGILFSRAPLGKRIVKGEVLGTVTDPITNARSDVVSPYQGRILGMALDQVVLPGFAAYHIGIQTPEAILIEEGFGSDEDGDDAPVQNMDSTNERGEPKPQDVMDDEEE